VRIEEVERLHAVSLERVRSWLRRDVEAEPLSSLRPAGHARYAYRLEGPDGETWKLRLLPHPDVAERVASIVGSVPGSLLARVLFRAGNVLVEEWVDGTPLSGAIAGAPAHALAGDLLGRLHVTPAPGAVAPFDGSTTPSVEEARAQAGDLAVAGAIRREEANRVRHLLQGLDPGTSRIGVVHGDFVPENLVLDPAGRVRAVDNEGIAFGPVASDFGVVALRWPMGAGERRAFLTAYRRHRDEREGTDDPRFWRLCSAVKSAHVRVVRLRLPDPAPLEVLRRLLGEAPRTPPIPTAAVASAESGDAWLAP
jgi:hypothetical protein